VIEDLATAKLKEEKRKANPFNIKIIGFDKNNEVENK